MTRIDEALRRATARRDVPAVVVEEFTLAHYPREAAGDEPVGAWYPREAAGDEPVGAWLAGSRRRAAPPPPGIEEKLVVRAAGALAEQYRRIPGLLADARRERGLRALIVTSPLDDDGKTRTALDLALSLGEAGDRVLLIDGDLRRPSLHQLLDVANDVGLAEELRAPTPELSCMDFSPVLSVMTAGHPPPDPLSLLTSDRLRLLLERGALQFDWVLIDAPPITLAPDASLLARTVQAVVVVIGGATPLPVAAAALARVGRQYVLGTVLSGNTPAPPPPSGA